MVYIGLNTGDHERTAPTGGNPLPAGLYTGVVTRTQMKKNSDKAKDPSGQKLEVEFDITSPAEFTTRKFWDNFNLINSNQQAVQIAKEQLSDLAKAAGLETLSDDTDLHGKEVTLILKVNPASGSFQASNECQKYWPVGTTIDEHNAWMKSGKKAAGATAPAAPAQKPGWGNKSAATAENMHGDKALDPATGKPAAAAKPWARKS